MSPAHTAVATFALLTAAGLAQAQMVQLRVTVENLAPTNSVAFAGLRFGFHDGTFDSFNQGQAAFLLGQPTIATAPIVSIAEGGTASTWFPAFAAAEPNATFGSILRNGPGALRPGETSSGVFTVNPSVNRFFTFGAMVVPSNDHFIGNDNPMQYMLFDAMGNLNITSISQRGNQIWDAGSETTNPANAAFLMNGVNANRVDENGVVRFDFMGLDAYNGLTTAAGYTFNRQFGATDEIYRISFQVIPTPGAAAVLGLGGLMAMRRRR
ncbi:MAG: spondin domain-containing protein [bacterium]